MKNNKEKGYRGGITHQRRCVNVKCGTRPEVTKPMLFFVIARSHLGVQVCKWCASSKTYGSGLVKAQNRRPN